MMFFILFDDLGQGIFLSPLEEQSSLLFNFVFKMFSVGAASLPEGGMGEVPKQIAADLPEGISNERECFGANVGIISKLLFLARCIQQRENYGLMFYLLCCVFKSSCCLLCLVPTLNSELCSLFCFSRKSTRRLRSSCTSVLLCR